VLYWLVIMTALSVVCTIIFQRRQKVSPFDRTATRDSLFQIGLILPHSVIFAYIPWAYIHETPVLMVASLTVIMSGLAAGAAALTTPFVPGFLATTYPSMLTLTVCLYMRGNTAFIWLSVGTAILLVGLTWFAVIMSRAIKRSMTTAAQNAALVTKLRTALIQTDEANRAKSVFLASASHDLRQPLHALGLLVETLGGTKMDGQQTEIQDHMMSAIDSTRGMLDALLNISKLDAGAISAAPKPFLVNSVFRKLESELAPTADEHNLIYRSRETIAAAYSDRFIVELILRNLIANAIRYTHKGGLLIACRKVNEEALSIEVWDTGIGIAENKIDEIFSEFKQLDNPERDAQKGFGLGLAIAQGLAKTIDTEIVVKSRLNKGSVFSFKLPISSAQVIEDIPSDSAAVDFSGRTVLIIDDDPRVRASMHNLMLTWGCECVSGESAKQAIDIIGDRHIDVLLTDYRLREGLTGRDAIQDLRQHLKRQVPAIIITGDTGADLIQEAQSVDALLLHKPASTSQLQLMIRKLLN